MTVGKEIYMIMTSDNHHKQWEARIFANEVQTKWGRIGGTLSKKDFDFETPAEANKYYEKKIKEKLNKGYKIV